jgi:hypothetical protein
VPRSVAEGSIQGFVFFGGVAVPRSVAGIKFGNCYLTDVCWSFTTLEFPQFPDFRLAPKLH